MLTRSPTSYARNAPVRYVLADPKDPCNPVVPHQLWGMCDGRLIWVSKARSDWWVTTPHVITARLKFSLQATNNPAPGVFICADGDPPGEHWIAYYWTAVLSIEFVLLLLSLYKAWVYRNAGNGLMRSLTKGSVIYFVLIWWIYLGNQILWIRNRVSQDTVFVHRILTSLLALTC